MQTWNRIYQFDFLWSVGRSGKLLLVLASSVILGSESRVISDYVPSNGRIIGE